MSGNKTSINSLSDVLIIEILIRLPVKSILICKTVCKNWLTLISSPTFAEHDHLPGARPELVLRPVCPRSVWRQFYLLSPENDIIDGNKLSPITSFNIDYDSYSEYSVVSSCNGCLLLIRKPAITTIDNQQLYLFNPVTREYSIVYFPSQPNKNVKEFPVGLALGFSSTTNKYKVVRLVDRIKIGIDFRSPFIWLSNSDVDVEVHTLGSGTWRTVAALPAKAYLKPLLRPYFNGAIHWLSNNPNYNNSNCVGCIVYFDCEREQIGYILPPPQFEGFHHQAPPYDMMIDGGVLEGCLYICDRTSGVRADVWVMKEYGVRDSWTKEFVIDIMAVPTGLYRLLKVCGDGEILMFQGYSTFVFYDSVKNKARRFLVRGVQLDFEVIYIVPSFASLKNFLADQNGEVLRVEDSTTDREVLVFDFEDSVAGNNIEVQ